MRPDLWSIRGWHWNDLIFAPPYSPDLNPIEMPVSKLKPLIREVAARTYHTLWKQVGVVCDLFQPNECRNYFIAAGYGVSRTRQALERVVVCLIQDFQVERFVIL